MGILISLKGLFFLNVVLNALVDEAKMITN